jgi:hypothetical protein
VQGHTIDVDTAVVTTSEVKDYPMILLLGIGGPYGDGVLMLHAVIETGQKLNKPSPWGLGGTASQQLPYDLACTLHPATAVGPGGGGGPPEAWLQATGAPLGPTTATHGAPTLHVAIVCCVHCAKLNDGTRVGRPPCRVRG